MPMRFNGMQVSEQQPPWFRRSGVRNTLLILLTILLAGAIAGYVSPAFATVDNMFVIIRAASMTGVVAIAMSYVTISGNLFALSASSMGALIAVVFALATAHFGFPVGLIVALAIAVACGIAQGVTVSSFGNPIIATLAFGTVFRGLAAYFSGNSIVRIDSDAALWLGTARPFGIPTQSWIFVLIAVLSWAIVRHTRLGREIILCGSNPHAARASGLNLGGITTAAFVFLCVGTAVMAVLNVCQFSQAKADLFSNYDFDYIAAVLVGGISLSGGRGTPLQAALGAVLIAVLQNFMLLNGFSAGLRMTVVGGLVVAAISVFHLMQGGKR